MIEIKVPPLGESIVEATVARWLKNEGDAVSQGETLVELETDKITVEVPALKAGVLARRLVGEGDVVKVEQTLAEVDERAAGAAQPAAAPSAPATGAAPTASASATAPAAGAAPSGDAPATSPAVRRMAAEEGLDPAQVGGSGRGGRVTKTDMVNAVEARQADAGRQAEPRQAEPRQAEPRQAAASGEAAQPAAAAPRPASLAPRPSDGQRETREKMTTRRKRIAENLLQAQHATAHLTTFNEVDMTAVNALRERMRDRVEKEHGVKLTIMPFFIKAACMALEAYPVVNAQVDGDSIVYKHYVNMGIAVASEQGLVVPNVKDAHAKGMLDVSREMSAVARRARDGKLTMDDLTGGTFTITNGGVFGSLVSTPIINYPQVAILGLHKIQDRPVAIDGRVEIRPMMYIALSYDHRIIDGQQAVLFLVRVKELMEDPAAMLIA